jgi:hypothetical protein
MEKTIDTLFGSDLFSSIYFVDSNPAKVETIEVMKIDSEIKEVKKEETFDLSCHTIDKKGLLSLNIREDVKKALISKLDSESTTTKLKYFKRGFIKNMLGKKNPRDIVAAFDGKDWIITSDEIILELSSISDFEYMAGYGDIRLVGKIGGALVFKIKGLENSIYMGNKDSITAVFNRSMEEDENGVVIEYLIQANKGLDKIIVN